MEIGKYDTFHAVSQRVSEYETDMLIGGIELADRRHEFVTPKANNVFRRMLYDLENMLLDFFDSYKEKHAEKG